MQNHYLKVKYIVGYCLYLARLPFSPLLFSPCPCLDGELTAVASRRVCLVAAGFGCQVLGYHSHSGIWVCNRLWHWAACSCEALAEVVSGQAASSMAEPLADHLPLCVPATSWYGIRNPHAGLLRPLWVGSDKHTWFYFRSVPRLSNYLTHKMPSHQKLALPVKAYFHQANLHISGQILQDILNASGHICFWRSLESVLWIVGKWTFPAVSSVFYYTCS